MGITILIKKTPINIKLPINKPLSNRFSAKAYNGADITPNNK